MGIADRDWMRKRRTDWAPRDFTIPNRPPTETHPGQLQIRVTPTLRKRIARLLNPR